MPRDATAERKRLAHLREAYKAVLATVHGRAVFADQARFGHLLSIFGTVDPYEINQLEGRRQMILRWSQFANMEVNAIEAIVDQATEEYG